jgi:uncharacterized membrane protein YsdA (DUF1294 family)
MYKYIFIYLIVINLIGFITMHVDKRKSEKRQWRVPESQLFGIAIVFGSIGILSGMYTFRHKTKHIKFVIGIPLVLIIQIIIVILLNN